MYINNMPIVNAEILRGNDHSDNDNAVACVFLKRQKTLLAGYFDRCTRKDGQ